MKKNFWKKTAAGLMALLIVAGVSPVAPFSQTFERAAITASAANGDVVDSGNCGKTAEDNVTWELTKNADDETKYTLTIRGTGDMADYDSHDTQPWTNYKGSITYVEIESGITSIGEWAFQFCTGLTSITIPDSVTSISDNAFYGCEGLPSITIPDSVKSIGIKAFESCKSLTSITIPGSVTSIGDYAFDNCRNLTSVEISDGVTNIGKCAFYYCSSLKSVALPGSVTSISDKAFSGCDGLTSITIPDSVTSIGDKAFSGCVKLESITIPDSVTSIGASAFKGCQGLTSITIPEGVESIGDNAFDGSFMLTSVTIPASLKSMGNTVFNTYSMITSLTYCGSVLQWAALTDGLDPFLPDRCTITCLKKDVVIAESINGTVTADKMIVAPDETVTLTVTPDEGYSFGSVSVKDTDDEDVELTDNHDGTYSFTMPAEDVTVSATFMQNVIPVYREVELTFDSNGGSGSMDPIVNNEGTAITLPECGFTAPEGKVFKCWSIRGAEYNAGASFNMKIATATAIWQNVPVTYLDENGVEQTCTNYTVLTGNEETLGTAGQTTWYVVKDDKIEFNHITYLNGDVHIILCDDKTMKVSPNSSESALSGLSSTLTIYGQSKGTGKLDLVSSGGSAIASHSVIINGGTVIAMGGLDCSGIYGSGDVTINGGNVTAEGASYGIKANGDVTINGGNVTAGSSSTPGIYAGKDIILGGAEINSKSYAVNTGGAVKVKDGMALKDEDGNIYYGTLTDAEKTAIAGKTLAPFKPESLASTSDEIHLDNNVSFLTVSQTYLDGYDFGGFMVGETPCDDMAAVVTAVKALRESDSNAVITITPVFTQKTDEYALTIENGHLKDSTDTNGSFKASTQLYAVADAPEEGYKFSHWEVDGMTVGYETTYAFRMPSKAMTLTAKYVDENETVTKTGVGYIENVYKPEDGKLSFVAILSVPEGCQMLKAGIVAQKKGEYTVELTEDNARFVRFADTSADSYTSFKYTWTLTPSNADTEWTVRAYLVYIDENNTEKTVYGRAKTKKLSNFE